MSVFEAEYVTGDVLMVDYTPPTDTAVAAGEVVIIGDTPRIAHRAIEANPTGQNALAASGGIYKVPKDGNAIAAGKKVYWDDTNDQITETASTHKVIGYTVSASLAGDTHQDIVQMPVV
ncbi:MAG: hypothetical protein COA78_24775 [Blastopirellula sp.]|nr:MAG: hypothetical protein COA78_24775 [Blastopirellula sp.]